MTFVKGKSGNPGGRAKASVGIAELARMKGKRGLEILTEIMEDETLPAAARISAAGMLLDRGYGKPAQFTTDDTHEFRKVTEMSDHELDDAIAQIRARLRAYEGNGEAPPDEKCN